MARFSAHQRVRAAADYQQILAQRAQHYSAHFALHVRPCVLAVAPDVTVQPDAQAPARLGLVIAKRYAAKSVERNRIKRVIRETFRQQQLVANDYVVRLRRRFEAHTVSSRMQKKQVSLELHALLLSYLTSTVSMPTAVVLTATMPAESAPTRALIDANCCDPAR